MESYYVRAQPALDRYLLSANTSLFSSSNLQPRKNICSMRAICLRTLRHSLKVKSMKKHYYSFYFHCLLFMLNTYTKMQSFTTVLQMPDITLAKRTKKIVITLSAGKCHRHRKG